MWLALAVLGCPKRQVDADGELASLLARADLAWEGRALTGLDPVNPLLRDAWSRSPGDPGASWRLVRQRLAEGLATADPRAELALYAEARAVAVLCLDRDGLFARRRADAGWEAALAAIRPERRICAAWGALAWTRWLGAHGAEAAALDLPVVDALAAAGSGGTDPDCDDVSEWAAGLAAGLRPAWDGRDPTRASALLDAVVARDPGSVLKQVDRQRVAPEPEAIAALRRADGGGRTLAPEERGALRHLPGP